MTAHDNTNSTYFKAIHLVATQFAAGEAYVERLLGWLRSNDRTKQAEARRLLLGCVGGKRLLELV